MQMVLIQGFKRILKSQKQNIHGSLKLSRQIFTFFFLNSIFFTSHCNYINYRCATGRGEGEGLPCPFLRLEKQCPDFGIWPIIDVRLGYKYVFGF